MCICRASHGPPVVMNCGVAARMRGPGMRPESISLRSTMSVRGLLEAALTAAVMPWSSTVRALCIAISMFSSGGMSPTALRVGVSQ